MGRAWIAVLVGVLFASALPAAASAAPPPWSHVPAEQYWLGPYFAGMRLEATTYSTTFDTFIYGTCEQPESGEGGCSPPVEAQNASSCSRNPIGLDRLPEEVFLLRGGGLATVYEPMAVDVGTGGNTVTMYADLELMSAALRDFYAQSQTGPEPLAPPEYPLPVLRELKRVTAVAGRLGSAKAIARATGLSEAEVRLRLRIAELLGPDALDGVPPPTMSVATVERLRQLAFDGQFNPARGARRHGMSKAEYLRKIRRVRGLTGYCPVD